AFAARSRGEHRRRREAAAQLAATTRADERLARALVGSGLALPLQHETLVEAAAGVAEAARAAEPRPREEEVVGKALDLPEPAASARIAALALAVEHGPRLRLVLLHPTFPLADHVGETGAAVAAPLGAAFLVMDARGRRVRAQAGALLVHEAQDAAALRASLDALLDAAVAVTETAGVGGGALQRHAGGAASHRAGRAGGRTRHGRRWRWRRRRPLGCRGLRLGDRHEAQPDHVIAIARRPVLAPRLAGIGLAGDLVAERGRFRCGARALIEQLDRAADLRRGAGPHRKGAEVNDLDEM